MHVGSQEQGGGDDGDDEDLHGLEDIDEGVALDEEPLLVEVGLE